MNKFEEAILKNNIKELNILLDGYQYINVPNINGTTLLFKAVVYNNIEAVKLLLNKGADVNVKNSDSFDDYYILREILGYDDFFKELAKCRNQSPMDYLVNINNKEIIKLFLQNGGNPNFEYKNGLKGLYNAILDGDIEFAIFLLNSGADIIERNKSYYGDDLEIKTFNKFHIDKSSADLIFRNNNLDLIKQFANHNAIINYFLCYTISNGKDELSKVLIEFSQDTNQIDNHRKYRMDIGEYDESRWEVWENYSNYPLELAVSYEKINFVELLLKKNANPNITHSLHRACKKQNLSIVKLLVENGADVNATNKYGTTALYYAIDNNSASMEIVELLLKNNANPNVDTILHIACRNQNLKIIKLLVENGADVNFIDNNGRTALFDAINAKNANKEIIRYLIANGADIHKEDNNGISPLSFAESNKISLVKVLTEHEKIKPSETPLSNITNNEQSILDKMVLQKKVIDKLKDDVKSIKEKTNNNQILDEYKIQIDTFQNTILSQSNEIIELQNKLLKKEEDIKELINNFTSKINTLEEKIKKQKVVKTMTPLVIPVEKHTINKTDGELIKRDSFDDF